jgi:hypothetical protein
MRALSSGNARSLRRERQKLTSTKTLSHYLTKITRLGGYLGRANDPLPGNRVMCRGLSRLTYIKLGAMTNAEFVGN